MTRFSSISFSALALVLFLSAASCRVSSASIFDTIKSKVDEITNAVADKVDSAKGAIADHAGPVKDAIADKLDSAKIADSSGPVKVAIADKLDTAKNAVSDTAVSVKNAVADKIDAAKNVLSAKCPPSGFDSVANFSITAYAAAPWYPQKQVRNPTIQTPVTSGLGWCALPLT